MDIIRNSQDDREILNKRKQEKNKFFREGRKLLFPLSIRAFRRSQITTSKEPWYSIIMSDKLATKKHREVFKWVDVKQGDLPIVKYN